MEITQLYTDTSGNSHFEKIPIIMEEESEFGFFSGPNTNVDNFHFQNIPSGHIWEETNATHKIYVVVITGVLELGVNSGEKREFEPGDIILLNDLSGNGHKVITHSSTVGLLLIHLKDK